MSSYTTFTSESVCAGHPDKVCDQISDAILDAALTADPDSRTAIETAVTHNHIILMGEIKTHAHLDYARIAKDVITQLGYIHPQWGFSDQSPIDTYINQQSSEIAIGVEADGAGDQGMMFGYACRETSAYMPLPITLAHALTQALDNAASGPLPYLRPDGKAQVTVRYHQGRPTQIDHVTIAKPHDEDVSLSDAKADIYRYVVVPTLATYGYEIPLSGFVLNGTGVWHHPGPASDAGLTGRKIVVDTYGGYARVGGGAFSGKDPSKVDRSAAYAARYLAKNLVAAGLADRAEVALAYFIGAHRPVMQEVETFGTAHATPREINAFCDKLLDTSVKGIIHTLDLRRPLYQATAAYGHFGRADLPWEQIRNLVTQSDATIPHK